MKPLFHFALLLPTLATAADWPRWRGPDGAGEWRDVRLPETLSAETVERVWEAPIGGGYSGVVVVGDAVLAMDRPAVERDGESRPADEERVLRVDRESGKTIWAYRYPASYKGIDYGNGPRATPLVDGSRVYTFGAVGHLACLDLESGKPLWEIDTKARLASKPPTWGHAASPVVRGARLFVQVNARPNGTVMAFDKTSGKELWRAREERPGYSTPIFAAIPNTPGSSGEEPTREQLVVWTADSVFGLSLDAGKLLWRDAFRTSNFDVAIASPVVVGAQLFVSGYWDGARALRLDGKRSPSLVWRHDTTPSCLMSTPLFRDGHLYALDKKDGLLCVDWASGKVLWKDDHRLTPRGRNPHATIVWAGARAIALNATGELVMMSLNPAGYEEHGRVPIIDFTWAHPAFTGQDVFVRNDRKLVRVRVRDGKK